jgi:hypothetical protein
LKKTILNLAASGRKKIDCQFCKLPPLPTHTPIKSLILLKISPSHPAMNLLAHPMSWPTEPLATIKSIIAGLWNLLFAGPIKFTLLCAFPKPTGGSRRW